MVIKANIAHVAQNHENSQNDEKPENMVDINQS